MRFDLRRGMTVLGIVALCTIASGAWYELNSGVSGPLYGVHFPTGTQVGYAVGADMDSLGKEIGLVLKTTDGGDTWVKQYPGQTRALRSAYFKDNDTGYAVGDFGTAIRTTNGGLSWISMSVGVTVDLTRIQFPEDGGTGYIFTHPASPPSVFLKTTDGGQIWTEKSIGGPSDVTRGGSFANDTIGVAVGDDGLVLGIDGPQDPKTNADLLAVAFAPGQAGEAYLIGNDSTQGVIRYTDDGGAMPWDSVHCMHVTAFYGLDVPHEYAAYVCSADGMIFRSIMPTYFVGTTTPMGLSTDLYGLHFPNGPDTGYAVGARGVILRTNDGGIPIWYAVAEGKEPVSRPAIRIASNPTRQGIAFSAEAGAQVTVFDASGRVVVRQTAARGLNFVPLSKAGVYIVKAVGGRSATTKVVVQP